MTTDEKLWLIRTKKRIGKMLFWTAAIATVINLFSVLNTIMMMSTDMLNKQNEMSMEVDELKQSIDAGQKDGSTVTTEAHSIGEFTITHYANDERCCGKTDGITATGTQATVGRTIAVDPEIIPLGSTVIIDGQEYIAEDVGGAVKGRTIDIFVGSYDEAVNRGKITREVFTN